MKYLRFVVFFLLCAPAAINAQEVIYSQYDKFDFRAGDYAVVGMVGGRLYNYRHLTGESVLDVYDDSMNKVAQVILDFFPEKIYDTRFIAYNDKIIVLYQGLESNKVVQYAALLDDKGKLINKPIELGKVKTGIFGAMKTYFQSAVSDNKKRIVIYNVTDKGSETEFEGRWLDDNLTILKRSKATFKADNTIEHADVNIDNDGNVYMAAFTPVGSLSYADRCWLLKLAPGATKFEPKEMSLDEKFAASGYMKVDNVNGRIYFGGFYADKKNNGFDGLIYASYDIAGGAFLTRKLIPFDQALINAAGIRRRNHAFDNYEVKQLIVRNDGGFVMVAEVHYITSRSSYDPASAIVPAAFGFYSYPSSATIREYHYKDIMALAYNKDGVREWNSIIPKEQYSQEDGGAFSSYALLNTGGTLGFLFNDFNTSRSRIQLATVSPDGKTDEHSFSAEGNDYPDWMPRSGKQVSGRVIIVPCMHKKQICFAKVVF